MEREARNQEEDLKNGAGALELYQPESQVSDSAPDALHKSHPKSGAVNSHKFDFFGGGDGMVGSIRDLHATLPLPLPWTIVLCTVYYMLEFPLGWGGRGVAN